MRLVEPPAKAAMAAQDLRYLIYLLGIGATAAVLAIGLLSWESNRHARLFRNNETLWDYQGENSSQTPTIENL